MAKSGRFLMTIDDDFKNEAILQQKRNNDKSLAAYFIRLAKEDIDKQYTSIKNEDIYNKVIDLNVSINEVKEMTVSLKEKIETVSNKNAK